MILSASQLCALTGRVRPSAQRRTLDHLRIPYRLRPDGSIVVFETEAENQGLDPQKLLGHTDASMTRRYLRDRGVKVVQGPSIGHVKNRRARSQ